MSSAKPRDRKCATCRFYEPSPLWRRGWCRNPLLYDPHTNHLVEADSLACSRTFIDYWEARPPGQKGFSTQTDPNNAQVRRAPSIPLTPTGPGGAPLRGNGATVAAVQAAYQPRDHAPQLSLVRPAPPLAGAAPPPVAAPPVADTQPLEQVAAGARPTPAPLRTAPPSNAVVAGRPEPALQTEDRRRTQSVLAGALILALAVLAFLFVRVPHTATTPGTPTVGVVALGVPAVVRPTAVPPPPPSATPRPKPTLVPTPLVLALRPGANVQMTGLTGVTLNVRQAATTRGRVIGGLAANVTAHIVAGPQVSGGVTWWQITGWDTKGTVGWASAKYLKPVP